MKRLALPLALIAAVAMANELQAQVVARSYSNGGVATANAAGNGNTQLNAIASATHGGRARAEIVGSGRRGGYATGTSVAAANGGVAISSGRSNAVGWAARSDVETVAGADHGIAIANGDARARGNGLAISRSHAFGTYGVSVADSAARARGLHGGRAVAVSEATSDAVVGYARSRSRANALGLHHATAIGRSQAISLGYGRHRVAGAQADAQANWGGHGSASAFHLNY